MQCGVSQQSRKHRQDAAEVGTSEMEERDVDDSGKKSDEADASSWSVRSNSSLLPSSDMPQDEETSLVTNRLVDLVGDELRECVEGQPRSMEELVALVMTHQAWGDAGLLGVDAGEHRSRSAIAEAVVKISLSGFATMRDGRRPDRHDAPPGKKANSFISTYGFHSVGYAPV